MKAFIFCAILGLVVCAPSENSREKRQINFINGQCNFMNGITNPCRNGRGQVYFAINTDTSKFIQCSATGEMYIVQCPNGKVYNQATKTCVSRTLVNPVVNTGIGSNPCTAVNLARGNLYFSVQGNTHQFIECTPGGNANVLTCPSQLVWDQARLSCVYTFVAGQPLPTSQTAILPSTGVSVNPCLNRAGQVSQFYSHPDPHKFIQCDVAGDAYVLTCPAGLVWNTYSNTCTSTFTNTGVAAGNGLLAGPNVG